MSLIDHLRHVTLLAGLDDEALETLAGIALERRIPAGQVLFRQGQDADGFYVVLDGRLKVYKLSPDGRQQILHVFGPGQALAEAAVVAGEPFPAYAEALAESRVAYFPRDRFLRELEAKPDLARGMILSLARLCHELAGLVEELALQDVAGRLARYLTELARRKGVALEDGRTVRLDLAKGELARRLGTAPETLSRALGKLAAGGLVAVEGPRVTFTHARGLAVLAGGLPPGSAGD